MIRRHKLRLSLKTIQCLVPPQRIRTWDWVKKYGVNKKGDPFNYLDYPWVESICDAWDDPLYKIIAWRAGSRLGKTETAMQLHACAQSQDPDVGMLGGPTEDKVKEWLADRVLPIFANCNPTRHWVPERHARGRSRVLKLKYSTIYGAWSGSPTTLGDLDPRYLFGHEVDKFTKNTSEEADPLDLLLERGAEIPDRKAFIESTPTVAERSRIDKFVRGGTDHRWNIECPKCKHYQPLFLGGREAEKKGGLIWDKGEDGKSDPQLAYDTARYCCRKCNYEIDEEERLPAIRRGLAVPRGCHVRQGKKGRRIVGQYSHGPVFSFSLSRLYGATFSFGDYARSYLLAKLDGDPQAMRNWLNNWAGLVWVPHRQHKSWEDIAAELTELDRAARIVPSGCTFLTVGVDVQVDHWVFVVTAWDNRQRGHVVHWGICHSWDQLKHEVIQAEYSHADGGPPLIPMMSLVDARDGNRSDEVRDFCLSVNKESGPWCFPCFGARVSDMQGRPWRKTAIEEGQAVKRRSNKSKRKGFTGFFEVLVNTNYYQAWIHNALHNRGQDDASSLLFPREALQDDDLWQQLTNEVPDWEADKTGNEKVLYVRTSLLIPNDLRDATRYSRVAADIYVNNNWNRVPAARILSNRKTLPAPPAKKAEPKQEETKDRWIRRPDWSILTRD